MVTGAQGISVPAGTSVCRPCSRVTTKIGSLVIGRTTLTPKPLRNSELSAAPVETWTRRSRGTSTSASLNPWSAACR